MATSKAHPPRCSWTCPSSEGCRASFGQNTEGNKTSQHGSGTWGVGGSLLASGALVGCSERDEGVAPASWVLGGLGPGLRAAGERGIVAYAEPLPAAVCSGLGAASRIAKVPSVHAVVVLLRPAARIGYIPYFLVYF